MVKLVSNPEFLPRCEWALRTGVSVALMSGVALVPMSAGIVALPGFGAFVAVMVVERTLGKTLANVVGCTKSGIYACVGCKLLQLFLTTSVHARKARIALIHVFHFLVCYLMARVRLPAMARKLGLSMFPLLLVNRLPLSLPSSSADSGSSDSSMSSSNDYDNDDGTDDNEGRIPTDDTLDLQLLVTTLAGCTAALVSVGLLPWPSLAALRLRNKRRAAGELLAELLRSFVASFTSVGGVAPLGSAIKPGLPTGSAILDFSRDAPPPGEDDDPSSSTPPVVPTDSDSKTNRHVERDSSLHGSDDKGHVGSPRSHHRFDLVGRRGRCGGGGVVEDTSQELWSLDDLAALKLSTPLTRWRAKVRRRQLSRLLSVETGQLRLFRREAKWERFRFQIPPGWWPSTQRRVRSRGDTYGGADRCSGSRSNMRNGDIEDTDENEAKDKSKLDQSNGAGKCHWERIWYLLRFDLNWELAETDRRLAAIDATHESLSVLELAVEKLGRELQGGRVEQPLQGQSMARKSKMGEFLAPESTKEQRQEGEDESGAGSDVRLLVMSGVGMREESAAVVHRFRSYIRSSLESLVFHLTESIDRDRTLVTDEEIAPDWQRSRAWHVQQARDAKCRFEEAYATARRDIYYNGDAEDSRSISSPEESVLAGNTSAFRLEALQTSKLTAETLLTLNAFIFNLLHICNVLLNEEEKGQGEMTEDDEESTAALERASSAGQAGEQASSMRKRTDYPAAIDRSDAPTRVLVGSWMCKVFLDPSAKGASQTDATKIALAMLLAGLLDHALLQKKVNDSGTVTDIPALTAFTVAYLCLGGNVATSFDTSKQRAEGTLAGAVFASIAFGLGIADAPPALLALALVVFVTLAGYARGSSSYSYAGTVAAFTAPVLMLTVVASSNRSSDGGSGGGGGGGGGDDDDDDSCEEKNEASKTLAYERIEHTLLGILVWLVVEFGVSPRHATAAARAATVSALRSLSEAIATLRDNDLKALEVAHCRALTAEEPTVKEVKDMVAVVSSQDVELALTDATASASGKRKVLQNGTYSSGRENPLGLFEETNEESVQKNDTSEGHGMNGVTTGRGSGCQKADKMNNGNASENNEYNDKNNIDEEDDGNDGDDDDDDDDDGEEEEVELELEEEEEEEEEDEEDEDVEDNDIKAMSVDATLSAVRNSTARARMLAQAAGREPELWHAPFPLPYVLAVLDAIDDVLAHIISAHRAIVAAAAAAAAAANACGPGSFVSPLPTSSSDSMTSQVVVCRFLLEPLRPVLTELIDRLAAIAKDTARSAALGLGVALAKPMRASLSANKTIGQEFGDEGGERLEQSERNMGDDGLTEAVRAFSDRYGFLCTRLQPMAKAASNEILLSRDANAERSKERPTRKTRLMSNLEVQSVNALVFSLLRLSMADIVALEERTAELIERHQLFVDQPAHTSLSGAKFKDE